MAKVSSLVENVKSYLEIRTAADELLKFVSFASLTELLETQSEVAASVTGDPVVDGRISEKLLSSTSSIPLYDAASQLVEEIKKQSIAEASAAVSAETATTEAEKQKSVETQTDVITKMAISAAPGATSALLASKKISMFKHSALSRVDYAASLTDISALFCNLIPATEMSLCTPLLDVRVIYPQESPGAGFLSTLRFVGVNPSAKSNGSEKSKATESAIAVGYTSEDTGRKYGYDVAGTELFCLPQTLAAPSYMINTTDDLSQRGVQILEPMMPLLTLDSANIQQIGINGSLYAQTKVDLKIILHDRSRLSDIEALVSAEVFPTVTFRLTYGWIHPDSSKFSSNPYARLLNSMRVTQDFAVSAVNLSTKDATSMNLGISLISLGSQVAKGAKVMTSTGKYIPYSAILTLIKQFIRVKQPKDQASFQSVGSVIVASSTKGTTSSNFINIESYYKLYDYVSSLTGENSRVDLDLLSELTTELNNIETSGIVTNVTEEFKNILAFEPVAQSNGAVPYGSLNKLNTLVDVPADFATEVDAINVAANRGTAQGKGERPAVVPLSALVGRLVAKPLVLTQPDIDEVRVHFFSFNSAAGKMAERNIGDFPIEIRNILEHEDPDKKEKVAGINQRSSAESALGILLKHLNDPASIYYGHNKEYVDRQAASDAVIKKSEEITEPTEADTEKTQEELDNIQKDSQSIIDANNAKYLAERKPPIGYTETAYVPPRIKSQIEVLPAYGLESSSDESEGNPDKPNKKIARIIIYDERAGGFNKLGNLVFSMINNNGIARVNKSAFSESLVSEQLKKISQSYDVKSLLTSKLSTESAGGLSDSLVNYALSNKKVARQIVSNLYPTITIGSDSTCIISANYSSQPSGEVASSYLLTALQGGGSSSTSGKGSEDDLAGDVLILPSSITLNMLGNVCINRGQTYFVDFNTGTMLDNSYTVQSVTHSMKPGAFSTSVTLMPTNSATMRSLKRQVEELALKIRDSTSNPAPSGESATSSKTTNSN